MPLPGEGIEKQLENLKDQEAQKAVEEKLEPAKNRHEMKAKAEPVLFTSASRRTRGIGMR